MFLLFSFKLGRTVVDNMGNKVITIAEQCHGEVSLGTGSTAVLHMCSVFHNTMFSSTLTAINFTNSPKDIARIILEFASTGGTEPTKEEIQSVTNIILAIQERRVGAGSYPKMVTRIIEG